jgi:hypothetical protein
VVGTANPANITKDTKMVTKLGRNVQEPTKTMVEKPPFDVVNWSEQKIGYWARQPLPGLSFEERKAEIKYVLWDAYQRWDARQPFDAYVPLCWHGRKYKIIRTYVRKLQQLDLKEFFSEELHQTYEVTLIPKCPIDEPLVQKIWTLIALGFEPRSKQPNILSILDIPVRTYYEVIKRLRVEIVRDALV